MHRDSKIFCPRLVSVSTIIKHSFFQALHFHAFGPFAGCNIHRSSTQIFIHWQPPPLGWFKINTDGSLSSLNNSAGASSVIRDSASKWVRGYSRKLKGGSVLLAELWGVYDGLSLACNLGINHVIFEIDKSSICGVFNKSIKN